MPASCCLQLRVEAELGAAGGSREVLEQRHVGLASRVKPPAPSGDSPVGSTRRRGWRPRSPGRNRRRRPGRRRAGCGRGWPRRCGRPSRAGRGGWRLPATCRLAARGARRAKSARPAMSADAPVAKDSPGERESPAKPLCARTTESGPATGASHFASRPGGLPVSTRVAPARRAGAGTPGEPADGPGDGREDHEHGWRASRWPGSAGETWRKRWGVPTAGSHQVRRPRDQQRRIAQLRRGLRGGLRRRPAAHPRRAADGAPRRTG